MPAGRGRRLEARVALFGGVVTRRCAALLIGLRRRRAVAREEAGVENHRARQERGHERRGDKPHLRHVIYHSVAETHGPQAHRDRRAPLAGRRALPALPPVVPVRDRHDVLGLSRRDGRRSARASAARCAGGDRDLSRAGVRRARRQPSRLPAIRLNTFDGRPVYRFRIGRDDALVYADTGERSATVSRDDDRTASRRPGPAAGRRRRASTRCWTTSTSGPCRGRCARSDRCGNISWPNGEQVYVSQTSGEVVQYTTTASRLGAYLGPIPHWLYFTPLRVHQQAWSTRRDLDVGHRDRSRAAGHGRRRLDVLAVETLSPAPARRRGSPIAATSGWHAIIGLIFGVSGGAPGRTAACCRWIRFR